MKSLIDELRLLLEQTPSKIKNFSKEKLEYKIDDNKWSKKEILGHLIDSAVNNLQRFTEIQFEPKPYIVRRYSQDSLVKANDYQRVGIDTILSNWLSLNQHIKYLMSIQNEDTLSYKVLIPEGEMRNLEWLMNDYVNHLKHHLNQIFDE